MIRTPRAREALRRSLSRLSTGLLPFVLGACGGGDPTGEPVAESEVVAFVAHDLVHSEPVLRRFEERTGIRVRIVGDTEATKTTGLAMRLLEMRDSPEADVWWNNEVMRTVELADEGLLDTYVPASAAGLPAAHCDPAGRWVGFSARARVILYHRDLVSEEDVPRSIFDLTDERFRGRVAIASPLFGTTATHVAALFATLGEERARTFLEDLLANDVIVAAGNAMARNLVAEGEAAVCLTDTDDANGALLAGKPVGMVYPDQDGIGTLVIPNTVAVVRGGPSPAAARELVAYQASREVELLLSRSKAAQMPLRDDVEPPGERFDLRRIQVMEVDWPRVAATIPESSAFVRDVFLR